MLVVEEMQTALGEMFPPTLPKLSLLDLRSISQAILIQYNTGSPQHTAVMEPVHCRHIS